MNTLDVDEDAVDLQDLQAQIDLSMSFAQNLVASWVKPAHYSQTTMQRDLENEIKEYMRRPARLGVGAPIPESQSLVREAARLKNKLGGGKKRLLEDEDIGMKTTHSDDMEESRASAINKKSRMDPLGPTPNKKQLKNAEPNRDTGLAIHPAAMKVMIQHRLGTGGTIEVNEMTSELFVPPRAARKKKKKKKKDKTDLNGDNFHAQGEISPDHILLSNLSTTVNGAPLPRESTTVECSNPSAPSVINREPLGTVPIAAGHHATFVDFLRQPLLNLDEHCGEASEEGEKIGTSNTTIKKKRKRRKKKKTQQNTEVMPTQS